jgi:hypothetical protein
MGLQKDKVRFGLFCGRTEPGTENITVISSRKNGKWGNRKINL